MEKSGIGRGRVAIAYLVVLLLFLGSGEVRGANETTSFQRTCESPSQQYIGRCTSDHNCGMVCRNERFTGGWCRGPLRRCFCTKPCP